MSIQGGKIVEIWHNYSNKQNACPVVGGMVSFKKVFLLGILVVAGFVGFKTMTKKSSIPVANVEPPVVVEKVATEVTNKEMFPEANRISQLFLKGPSKLPIVETVTYRSNVDWLKGRPAWIADYAGHYKTSRHFIARSLNGQEDYFTQRVSQGDEFNVFRTDKNIHFYLLVDRALCKMAFYYVDLGTNERVLLKTYDVGLGRKGEEHLTPLGRFSLGSKVAIYKPGTMGLFQEKKTEMITVFGTRWIPFDQEIEGCTASAKGLGIHGAPIVEGEEELSGIGGFESDGCIRLKQADMEELFSIIITKPTFVEIVDDFKVAKLPGQEVL